MALLSWFQSKASRCSLLALLPLSLGIFSCNAGNLSHIKIINGQTVASGFDAMASLTVSPGKAPFCGGTIVASGVLLTSAHCVYNVATNLYVNRSQYVLPASEQSMLVTGVVVHPNFDASTTENDIALVWYRETEPEVPTVTLAQTPPTQGIFSAFGWGSLANLGNVQPAALQKTELKFVDRSPCAKQLKVPLFDSQICAISPTEGAGHDTCTGDSGGPLMSGSTHNFTQVGIVSWGYGCAQAGKPGVYTNVAHFLPWIRKTIENSKLVHKREQQFEMMCSRPIEIDMGSWQTHTQTFRLENEFKPGSDFEARYACGDFEFSQPDISGRINVRDTTTRLVSTARTVERLFHSACGNFALLNMSVTDKGVDGGIANNHHPHRIMGVVQRPDFNDFLLNSTCDILDIGQAEVFVAASSGRRAVRFSGPSFRNHEGKLYYALLENPKDWPNTTPLTAEKVFLNQTAISIVNRSDFVAHGVFLKCRVPFVVSANARVESTLQKNAWHVVALRSLDFPWARIPAKNGKLRLTLSGISPDDFIANCRINN